jgi:hypothetical protein
VNASSGSRGVWVRVSERLPTRAGLYTVHVRYAGQSIEQRSPASRYYTPAQGWKPVIELYGDTGEVVAWFDKEADKSSPG